MSNVVVVKLDKKVFDEMNLYLKDGSDLNIHNLEKDATLLSLKAKFEDGYEAIVEVFTGTESVMSTAYLYDDKGNDVKYIECDEGLDVQYEFETSKGNYILNIELE